jgi:hypothetical protein
MPFLGFPISERQQLLASRLKQRKLHGSAASIPSRGYFEHFKCERDLALGDLHYAQ